MELKDAAPKESFMRQTPFYEIKLFGGMIVTIICLALSLSAYLKLEEISSDVFDVTDNWKTPPVTEVFVPLSFDADCPDGFSTITLEKSDFSGITKGPCGCVPNTLGYVSGIGNCSVEAEATAFCMSAPPRDEVKTKSWRESKICFKRDGKAATSWKNGYYRRPYPDQDGNCPKSYKRCGTGATYDKGAVCFPEDTICPVTGMLVAPVNDLPPPAEGGWVQNGTFPGGEYVLLTRREYEGERPMVDLEMHLTQDPTDGYLDGESYNPDNNKRGPCYLGSTQLFSDSPVEISDSFLWSFIVSYPGTCRRDDARFELFDRREMQRHFLENLEVGQSACNGLTLLPTDDPAYDAAQDPDFLNSGVSCDSNAAYQCSRPADQLTNCAVGDNICRAVINQNVCGQYAQAVRSLAGSDKTFGLYRRSEILWREDCDVSQDDIYSNMDPLRAALASQLAGVVLSYVLGILFGICYPLWGLYHSDIPGKLRIHNITEKRLTLIDPWIHLLKLGPLIAAIVFIGQIYRLYDLAGDGECSDPTTNSTFKFLGEALPSIYETSLANVLLESAFTLMGLYFVYSSRQSPSTVSPGMNELSDTTSIPPKTTQQAESSCCGSCCGASSQQPALYQGVEMGPPPSYPPPSQQAIHPATWSAPQPVHVAPAVAAVPIAVAPSVAPAPSWGAPPAAGGPPPGSAPPQSNWGAAPPAWGAPPPDLGIQQQQQQQPVLASPVGELVTVVVPFGSPPGTMVQCTTPSGAVARFVVPPGAAMGSTIQVRMVA